MKFDMNTIYIIVTVIVALYGIIKVIAPMTKTKLDDAAVAKIENLKAWGHGVAPHLWAIVEVLATRGIIDNKGPAKMNEFLKLLDEESEAIHGEKLPEQAANAAKLVAKGLSAADHLLDPTQTPAGKMD